MHSSSAVHTASRLDSVHLLFYFCTYNIVTNLRTPTHPRTSRLDLVFCTYSTYLDCEREDAKLVTILLEISISLIPLCLLFNILYFWIPLHLFAYMGLIYLSILLSIFVISPYFEGHILYSWCSWFWLVTNFWMKD